MGTLTVKMEVMRPSVIYGKDHRPMRNIADIYDEIFCSCAEDWFQCADGHCIHSSWRCDGHFDCMGGDGSDEENCSQDKVGPPPHFCSPSEFRYKM